MVHIESDSKCFSVQDARSIFNTIVLQKLQNLGLSLGLFNQSTPAGQAWETYIHHPLPWAQETPRDEHSCLIYTLFTHNCIRKHFSSAINNFTYNTIVIGLISKSTESSNREENIWHQRTKNNELTRDFRRSRTWFKRKGHWVFKSFTTAGESMDIPSIPPRSRHICVKVENQEKPSPK